MGPRWAIQPSVAAATATATAVGHRRCLLYSVGRSDHSLRWLRRCPGTVASSGLVGPLVLIRGSSLLHTLFLCLCLARLSNCFPVGSASEFCPLQQCWDSYYGDLEVAGIREDFHSQPRFQPDHSRSTSEWRRLCSIYRAFSSCVQNASRACLGDLNFHSTQRGVERKLTQYNCTASKDPGKRQQTEDKRREADEATTVEEEPKCIIQEINTSSYRHCAMFGDPHVRTFDGVFHTCRIQGAWPLIDNDFLTVQITSAPVGIGEGTSISEVTVVIKQNDLCALDRYVTYQAQNGELPGTFDDGLVEFNSIEILEYSPGNHVEIEIGYKQTVVIVRFTGHAYSVSVSVPEDIYTGVVEADPMDGTVQLCQCGCPLSERVDLNSYFGQKSSKLKRTVMMAKKEAVDRCRGLRVPGFYFDSCVYDLMTTGVSTFIEASYTAYSDLLRFVPDAVFMHKNSTFVKFEETVMNSGNSNVLNLQTWLCCSQNSTLTAIPLIMFSHILIQISNLTR